MAPQTIQGVLGLPGGLKQNAAAALIAGRKPSWTRFAGPDGKKTLGVHVYCTARAGSYLGTLRTSNGCVMPDGSGFCGALYFDYLTFTAPPGMEWVVLPQAGESVVGNVWTVASFLPNGSHFFRARGILERAFALVPAGNAAARKAAHDALRFRTISIAPAVTGYGPLNSLQPKVDRAAYSAAFTKHAETLLAAQAAGAPIWIEGLCNVVSSAMGPFWCEGQQEAGWPSGSGILPSHGYEQCTEAVFCAALLHRATLSRHPIACYHAETGQPIALQDWTVPPMRRDLDGEPGDRMTGLPCFAVVGPDGLRRYKRFNTGTCPYEAALAAYRAIDNAHAIRVGIRCIPMVEYASDVAARDDLLMYAHELSYGDWSNRPDERTTASWPGEYIPPSLQAKLATAQAAPKQGGWVERNFAWAGYFFAAALKYDPDPIRRNAWRGLCADMLLYAAVTEDKHGISGRYFSPAHMPANVSGVQTFHSLLCFVGMYALAAQSSDSSQMKVVQGVMARGLRTILGTLPIRKTDPAAPTSTVGPPHWIGTAVDNVGLAVLDDAHCYGEGDPAHVLAACALAWRAGAGVEPLQLALKHWVPHATLAERRAWLDARFPDKGWSAEMEAVLEQVLGAA